MVFLAGKEVQEAFGTFSDGPLVSLPVVGSHVMYFPQGHSEQVVSSRLLQLKSSSKNVFTVVEFALALQEAGCFFVVLKCVLAFIADVAAATSALRIPTIGIGAGTFCSCQVN